MCNNIIGLPDFVPSTCLTKKKTGHSNWSASKFIKVYQPYGWKVKSDDYSNRQKKDAAYAVLVEKFQEKYPNYTKEHVKEKDQFI